MRLEKLKNVLERIEEVEAGCKGMTVEEKGVEGGRGEDVADVEGAGAGVSEVVDGLDTIVDEASCGRSVQRRVRRHAALKKAHGVDPRFDLRRSSGSDERVHA